MNYTPNFLTQKEWRTYFGGLNKKFDIPDWDFGYGSVSFHLQDPGGDIYLYTNSKGLLVYDTDGIGAGDKVPFYIRWHLPKTVFTPPPLPEIDI